MIHSRTKILTLALSKQGPPYIYMFCFAVGRQP